MQTPLLGRGSRSTYGATDGTSQTLNPGATGVTQCSQALTKYLSGPRIGHGQGYTALFAAAQEEAANACQQTPVLTRTEGGQQAPATPLIIELTVTIEPGCFTNSGIIQVGDKIYKIPNIDIIKDCLVGDGNPQKLKLIVKKKEESVIGFSFLNKDGEIAKFRLMLSTDKTTFDLIEFRERIRMNRFNLTAFYSYSGITKNGIPHGKGKIFLNNGTEFSGIFTDGVFPKEGTLTKLRTHSNMKVENPYHGQVNSNLEPDPTTTVPGKTTDIDVEAADRDKNAIAANKDLDYAGSAKDDLDAEEMV